ncbi:hypothetical protein WG8_3647 [Paenibacillus sp. Aloe-11]|nr:hypothetical protein WG8_3647 [Paenibacillus sp. Aloe-11]
MFTLSHKQEEMVNPIRAQYLNLEWIIMILLNGWQSKIGVMAISEC